MKPQSIFNISLIYLIIAILWLVFSHLLVGEIKPLLIISDIVFVIITYSFILIMDRRSRNFLQAKSKIERQLQIVLDTSKSGMWEVDLEKNELYCSPGMYTMIGYKPVNDNEAFWLFRELIHPDDIKKLDEDANLIINNPELDSFYSQFRLKDIHGNWLHIVSRGRPVKRDESGKLVKIIGTHTDITARKKAEIALKNSKDYYRRLFDTSPIPLYIQNFYEAGKFIESLREKGVKDLKEYFKNNPEEIGKIAKKVTITRANQAALRLYNAKSIEDCLCNLAEVLIIDDMGHFVDQIISFSNGKNFWEGEARNHTFDGKIIEVIIHKNIFERKNGIISRVFVSLTDITELKKAQRKKEKLEAQLYQSQKMEAMGTLAGGIAHDFNNILMGIMGRISLLKANEKLDDYIKKNLNEMESYVNSAADLSRKFLDFAKGGEFDKKPLDINKLIQDTSYMFGRTKKEITIEAGYQKNIWAVSADRSQIEQVLINLYLNAWQAMPAGGRLTIETKNVILGDEYEKALSISPGKYVKISVTDTGIGMDKETQGRIFDPFFTTKPKGKGTGLGLTSAYGIIDKHKGRITVYSEPEKGTTFNIYLPASKDDIIAYDEFKEEICCGTGTILLVDDEKMIRDVGQQILEALGYVALTASGGQEAVEIYNKKGDKIDLVILDMIMPDMNGPTTFDFLKEINPEVKVLISSGYSVNGSTDEMMQKGCKGFIQKPFTMEQLSGKLKDIL